MLASQCAKQPRNSTVAKATRAIERARRCRPARRRSAGRSPPSTTANSAAMPSAITSACAAAASAAARLPEPSARATEEEMPPPIAPADIWPSAIWVGKTSARAARSTRPSWPTNQLSEMLTRLCIATFSTLGAARVRMVGTIGPASIICRRSAGFMPALRSMRGRSPRELISWLHHGAKITVSGPLRRVGTFTCACGGEERT